MTSRVTSTTRKTQDMAGNKEIQEETGVAGKGDDELPPLSYGILTLPEERETGMRLIADSIAQQRQTANLSIIFHPLCIAGLASAIATMFKWRSGDLGSVLIAISGTIIAYLAAVRMLTGQYLSLAESFNPESFLTGPDGREDIVIGAKFGKDIIGALILRPYLSDKEFRKQKKKTNKKQTGGVIRAWTTRLRYRNKGIGGDLLRFAIVALQTLQGNDAQISFDEDHANAARLTIDMFNRPFDKRDARAAEALRHAEIDCENQKVDFDESFKDAVRKYVKQTGK